MVSKALKTPTLILMFAFAAVVPAGARQAQGTASAPARTALPQPAAGLPNPDSRYRIGVGDLLDIRTLNQPKFSRDATRVDSHGMITLPYVGDVSAACMTEKELARDIAERYREYLKDPQVDVFIKEFQSQSVAVIGAVFQPGRFQLQRQVRLLELLTFVGGPVAERAGGGVMIIHAPPSPLCGEAVAAGEGQEAATSVYNLIDTLKGDEKANPFIQPGDVISIPEAPQAYVVGNVFKPSTILLKEPITVSRAIAMAGGTMRDTKSDRIRIIRQVPGGTAKSEIRIDLKAIERHKSEDVMLLPNDIVDVPESGTKSFVRSLVGTVAPAVSQLPVRVIP